MATTLMFTLRERIAAGRLLAGLARRDPAEGRGLSAEEWVAAQPGGERVQGLLRAFVRLTTYTGALDELSAEVAVLQLRIAMRENVRYLDSGWGVLVDGLRAAAETAGAEVRCGVTAEAVTPGRVELVGGEAVCGRCVVLAGLSPAAVARLTGAEVLVTGPAVEAACLDIALRSLPAPAHAWTLGIDEPVYVSAYSEWARLAPAGGAVVHVARPLRGGETVGREDLESVMDRVHPGWREALVHANFLPRMTVVHVAASPSAGLAGRPAVDAVPGVLLAGDWVGGEGWLADAAFASAEASARRALAWPSGVVAAA